jgi:hypothetical protein
MGKSTNFLWQFSIANCKFASGLCLGFGQEEFIGQRRCKFQPIHYDIITEKEKLVSMRT